MVRRNVGLESFFQGGFEDKFINLVVFYESFVMQSNFDVPEYTVESFHSISDELGLSKVSGDFLICFLKFMFIFYHNIIIQKVSNEFFLHVVDIDN